MKTPLIISLLVACVAILCGCGNRDFRGKYSIGMTKTEVLKQLGQPVAVKSVTKASGVHVDNQYWQRLPDGMQVEIWQYSDHFGHHLLYFTKGLDSVAGTSFLSNGQPF